MKKKFILIFGFTVAISHAQINARNTTPEYDSALAKKLGADSDPAIQGGILIAELRPWYGSAALMEINTIHKRIQKKSVADF
jgi:hypothetical protein